MVAENVSPMTVRDAAEADVPALTAIKGDQTEALHRDRLRDAHASGFRYLVCVAEQDIIAFACLVMRRPSSWSDANDLQHLPQIVDLQVKESRRGQGYGSRFVRAIEHIAAEAGYGHLYLSVEPLSNPGAYRLYQRLGYQPLQSEPYRKIWAFTDTDGKEHRGDDQVIDLVKQLKS